MTEALIASNVLLWIAVLALASVVLALTRQIGLLHERIAPAGALVAAGHGLHVGEAVPELRLIDLGGRDVRIGGAHGDGDTLLFFLSPSCPVCKTLLPSLLRAARDERPPLRVVLASDGGEAEEHRRFVADNQLAAVPYVISAPLGVTYQVAKLPYAVLIDGAGVLRAKGLVNTREHVESLFEARRLGVASIQDYIEQRDGAAAPHGRHA